MDFDWKAAVRKARKCGAGSSGQLNNYESIKFWREGGLWKFRNEHNQVTTIGLWLEIPVNTIHFKGQRKCGYAKMNARDETVVEELTKSIMRGDVKITGSYASVNNIGNPPVPGCKEIDAPVPVPIMCLDHSIYGHISKTRVTRGSDAWYIHTAFIGESTGPGNGRTKMQKHRVYMCGGPEEN